jgi:copper homeostasis protein
MHKYCLEIACFDELSALNAQEAGADRIEMCADHMVGGITPDLKLFQSLRGKIQIPFFAMIRPRGGNFVYSDEEFTLMKESIKQIKKMNADGFVFGILNEDKTVDIKRNGELVTLASPLPCTFHRAFDLIADKQNALKDLIECSFKTILTSGNEGIATDNINILSGIVALAADQIVIMPGGGIRSSNIELLKEKTKAVYYHSSAITQNGGSSDPEEIRQLKSKLS